MIHNALVLIFLLLLAGSGVYWAAQRVYPILIERRERKLQIESDPATNVWHPQHTLYKCWEDALEKIDRQQKEIDRQREALQTKIDEQREELAELQKPSSYEEHLLKLGSVASVEDLGDNTYKITENEFVEVCTIERGTIARLGVPTRLETI